MSHDALSVELTARKRVLSAVGSFNAVSGACSVKTNLNKLSCKIDSLLLFVGKVVTGILLLLAAAGTVQAAINFFGAP